MEEVAGKVALITGGASGIGLAMAKVFAEAQMRVVIADFQEDALERALAELTGLGAEAHTVQLDVTDRDAMARAGEEIDRRFGKLHVLCNNAGLATVGGLGSVSHEQWDLVMSVNVTGVFNGLKTFVPRILAHGEGGHVVNTASVSGLYATGMATLYDTTKFAVVGLSESLRANLARFGVGVSVLCPGPTKTGLSANTGAYRAQRTGGQPPGAVPQSSGSAANMDPLEVARLVLAGIQRNLLYIITHGEFADVVRARSEALLAAFPPQSSDSRVREELFHLLSPYVYETAVGGSDSGIIVP